jgi:hypothetical protein
MENKLITTQEEDDFLVGNFSYTPMKKDPLTCANWYEAVLPRALLRLQMSSSLDNVSFGLLILRVVLMTEEAFHVTLLVVHAIFVSRKIFRTMALNTLFDLFRRRPFRRLPFSVKVFVEIMYDSIDDLPRYFGASFVFLFGSDLLSGGQRPFRNRCVTKRSHRLGLDLFGERRDIVEPLCREFHSRVPPHHPIYDATKAIVLIVNDKVDQARADTQGSAKRAMSCVPLSGMSEHVIRHGCPRVTDFLFQKAGVPQPSAIPSAFLFKVAAIGQPACFHRI